MWGRRRGQPRRGARGGGMGAAGQRRMSSPSCLCRSSGDQFVAENELPNLIYDTRSPHVKAVFLVEEGMDGKVV